MKVGIFATSFALWSHTDDWGKGDDEVLQAFGYCYREITEQLIVMAAYIIGGQKHARKVAKEMVEYYRGHNQDTIEEWVQEFRK